MADELRAGDMFRGYRVDGQVGAGGMSVLYRATDERLGRSVALKVMASKLSADPVFRERFIKEARAASAIDHPHVIPIYEAGEYNGQLFIAMRLVPDGSDLRKLLRSHGTLDERTAVELFAQIAQALDAVHAAGLIHRDVKPDNVMLAHPDAAGGIPHVYLTDFGLTRAGTQSRLTSDGQVVGTMAYAAPEQIRGLEIDGRADTYSFGIMLFEALAGRRPFVRDNDAALMYAQLTDPPPSLHLLRPDLPEGVDQLLAGAMAKSADDRPASPADLIAEFATLVGVALDDTSGFRSSPKAGSIGFDPGTVVSDPGTVVSDPGTIVSDPATVAGRRGTADSDPGTVISARPVESHSNGATASGLGAPTEPSAVSGSDPESHEELVGLVAGAGGADDRSAKSSRRPLVLVVAAVVVVMLVAVGLVLSRRSGSVIIADETVHHFDKVTHAFSGITTDREWALNGAGDRVRGRVTFANPNPNDRTYTHDEVIPKSLAAKASDVKFEPAPTKVVRLDPVVHYDLTVKARSTTTLTYTIDVPPGPSSRLLSWAEDQKSEQQKFLKSADGSSSDSGKVTTVTGGTTTIEPVTTTGLGPDGVTTTPGCQVSAVGCPVTNSSGPTTSPPPTTGSRVTSTSSPVRGPFPDPLPPTTTTVTPLPAATFPPSAPQSALAKDPQSSPVCGSFPNTVTLTVSWQVPQSTGGAAITSYHVAVAAEGSNRGVGYSGSSDVAGNSTSVSITVPAEPAGVNGGDWSYAYDITAVNANGPGPAVRAVPVMPDVVGPGICDGDYWRRVRAVGLRGYTPNPVPPSQCSLGGRVIDQSPWTAGQVLTTGQNIAVKVYGYC